MADLTVFQRLRDAAVRKDGIRLEAAEVDELMEGLVTEILDVARSDDEMACLDNPPGAEAKEEEEEEAEPDEPGEDTLL